MANTKRHFISGKMNKGVDERLVPNGEYIDALNVRLGSTEQSEIGSVENSKGNTQLTTLEFDGNPLSSNARCIGAFEDGTRETIYWFIHDRSFTGINPAGATLDLIVSLNVKEDILTYHVISTSVLNFNPTYLITGIDMVEDFLFFTDDYNAPRFIDINKNYAEPSGGADQFTAEELLVIKKPPATAPTIQTQTIPGNEDFIKDRFVCFAYRYRYENNQYSATSQFSNPAFEPDFFNVTISTFLNEGMQNNDNNVKITLNTGGPLVKGFDLLYKESTSNVVKVIEKFDKAADGIADNTSYTYDFSNYKIFTVLPDSELLRLYDNVPRFAQAQTIMGNRLVYGNYVEGYNLKDKNNNSLNLDYTASLVTEEISTANINASTPLSQGFYTADPTLGAGGILVNDSIFSIDLSGLELKVGSVISLEFTFAHGAFSSNPGMTQQQGPTDVVFEYTLVETFLTDGVSTAAHKLATNTDFLNKLGTSLPGGTIKPVYDAANPTSCDGFTLTDIFNCAVQNILDAGLLTERTKFEGGFANIPAAPNQGIGSVLVAGAVGSDIINIQVPAMRRVNNVAGPTADTYEYFSVSSPNNRFSSTKTPMSLHSNRNYEVGLIYTDEFNRATTALVSTNNSVNVPCSNSLFKNSIQVNIPPAQLAPSFATRYKFCIKADREGYNTIYSNFYVQDPSTGDTYILLEGENASKVEEGSILNVKRDASGVVGNCVQIVVLEKKAQTADFLDPPPADSSGNIPLPSGTYIRVASNSINLTMAEDALISPGQQSVSNNINSGQTPQLAYTGLSGPDTGGGVYVPPTIPERSRIVLKFRFERLGTGDGTNNCERRTYDYSRTFFSSANYDNIIEWFNGDNIDSTLGTGEAFTGDGSAITNTYLTPTNTTGPSPTSPSYGIPFDIGINYYRWYQAPGPSNEIRFIMQGPQSCGGSKNKRSSIFCEWQVFRSENLLVFETEPSDSLADVWYEGSESYAIDQATGFHQGSDGVYQTSTTPATVNTTFGNCYSFGNGVESYKILDSIKGKEFNLGERIFSTSAEDYQESDRFAALTYSGVFNTETNVNKLNEFNLGILNFKNLEESFGPIQIISGRETDILTLQEDKISYVLTGKNLLSDAAAGSAITSVPEVLGTQIARVEEYGISSNPESFVQYGYDKFFTDAKRGALIQLRGSGQNEQLTVLSELGMRSWFRDLFLGSGDTQKLGAFDPYMNEFVLSSNTEKLPTVPVLINCGVQRRITVTSASPLSFTVNLGNTIGTCAISYNIISFSDPGSITIAEDYTGTSTNINTTGVGTFNFTKNSAGDEDVVITLTPASAPPGGKQVVVLDITVGCPQAQQITLTTFCVTKPSDAGKFIHNQYQWTDGTFTSPLQSEQVEFAAGTPGVATAVISSTSVITAPQGGGIIPNNGDVLSVISNAIPPSDNYKFDNTPPTNRLLFCRSALLHNPDAAGYAALLADPALQVLPLTGSLPTITGTHTLAAVGTGQYMYIVYDYFTS